MKRILLRNPAREKRLSQAMWIRAQGVPAEECVRHRLRGIWQIISKGLGLFWLLIVGLICMPIFYSVDLEQRDWLMFSLGVTAAGWLIVKVGTGLLLPRDGQILISAPVSNRLSLTHSFLTFPLFLLFLGGMAFWIFLLEYSPFFAFLRVLGWMLVPLLGVAWQCIWRGRASSFILVSGLVGTVAVYVLTWIDGFVPRFAFAETMEKTTGWLPSAWFVQGWWGAAAAGLVLIVTILSVWDRVRIYRFRATPGAQMSSAAKAEVAEMPEQVTEQVTVPAWDQVTEPVTFEVTCQKPNVLTRIGSAFWSGEERELAGALGFGYRVSGFVKIAGLFVLLLLGWWLPSWVKMPTPELGIFAAVLGPILVVVGLTGGWKSCVVKTAFAKFNSSGGRFISVLAALPISERMLFRMYLKEALVALLITVSLQLWLIGLVTGRIGFEVERVHWLVVLMFLVGAQTIAKMAVWTRILWQATALFHPGIRGDLKNAFCRMPYFLVFFPWFFYLLRTLGAWLSGDSFNQLTIPAFLVGVVWSCGICWLVRWLYNRGSGSAIVTVVKRKSFQFSR